MSKSRDCLTCKYFKSWWDEFFGEDEYEPKDSGRCLKGNSQGNIDDAMIGEGYHCDDYEPFAENS